MKIILQLQSVYMDQISSRQVYSSLLANRHSPDKHLMPAISNPHTFIHFAHPPCPSLEVLLSVGCSPGHLGSAVRSSSFGPFHRAWNTPTLPTPRPNSSLLSWIYKLDIQNVLWCLYYWNICVSYLFCRPRSDPQPVSYLSVIAKYILHSSPLLPIWESF